MTATIKINMDNAAFGDNDHSRAIEVNRILVSAAQKCLPTLGENDDFSLYDINGNKIGKLIVSLSPDLD